MSELRFHPFLSQWVITATHRQDRTFHPPDGYCPLCPTAPGGFPTEIPYSDYDIAVFENRFPSLRPIPDMPAIDSAPHSAVMPNLGVCEVVCYSSKHDSTLASMPLSQVQKLVRVWKDRYEALSKLPGIEYVFMFENKGKEVGVTLSHPHGQIYAYPFIPPVIQTELAAEKAHFETHGEVLMDAWLNDELKDGSRVVLENDEFAAVIPFFARYPYETYICSKSGLQSCDQFTPAELDALAEILHQLVNKFDRLFGTSLPYIMVIHQQPCRQALPYTRFHIEFYPPNRTAEKLKYLAGSEAGAGAYINDTLPEVSAQKLRDA